MNTEYIFYDILTAIELPARAYDLAKKRYEDLGEYLSRPESDIAQFNPKISPQGSFRLGTAIRPLGREEYDVDLNCVLRDGITEKTISQKNLKKLVGNELKEYRRERNINAPLEEKRRCWRLLYADEMSFHLDIVPGIPAPEEQRDIIKSNMGKHGALSSDFQETLSRLALYITDNEDPNFEYITDSWHISNPEGYARWFESRMMPATTDLVKASVDKIPEQTLKNPLQQVIQLLKRHRDVMYSHPDAISDLKPISIIITTLAAKAYGGEDNLTDAIPAILLRMGQGINNTEPRVPNPVNPEEDFADKWKSEPALEKHFRNWLAQAQRDLNCLLDSSQQDYWTRIAKEGFKVTLDKEKIESISQGSLSEAAATGPTLLISPDSAKPWGN